MFNLLIVDDEAIERQALRLIVERYLPQVQVVGEAENGRKAIELASELRPDVITMDIKMPGIDGVEAVRAIRRQFPEIKFIMVSAFDTFEYARQVMREGVKEYLLKPSRKEEIIEAVRRVVREIEEERMREREQEELRDKFHRALSLLETEWVAALLMDPIQDYAVGEWTRLLGLEMESGYAMLFTFLQDGKEWTAEEKAKRFLWLKRELKEQATCLVGPMMGLRVPVFVVVKHGETGAARPFHPGKVKAEAIQLARRLIHRFQRDFPNDGIFIGIGTPCTSVSRWVDSYYEALLASKDPTLAARYAFYGELPLQAGDGARFPYELEKRLLQAVKQGDSARAEREFESYFLELAACSRFDNGRIIKYLHELFALVRRMFLEMGIDLEETGDFSSLDTGEQLKANAKLLLRRVTERLRSRYRQDEKGLIQRARDFILEHYSGDLSLEAVAEYVQLSPYYFSKLFKEQCGISFIDYLTQVRIEKAKELMRIPDLSLKEIGLRVGYRDPNYFSRVFRKVTGLSPSDYRLNIAGEGELPARHSGNAD